MTKAHELRIFLDRARKAIVYVRLTTVRLSVCKFVFAVNIYSRGTVSFITLRDHKPNFAHKPTCRLTNPTKSNIGRVRKIILDRINKKNHESIQVRPVEKHGICDRVFKAIKTKKHHSFICFDIEEFYSSISQDLLNKVLDLASAYDIINDEETSCNTCKTFDPYAQTATLAKESRYKI